MPYSQSIFDNHNDNSINGTIWNQLSTTGMLETGGRLGIPSAAAYPQIRSNTSYNLANGIIGAAISRAGTAPTAGAEFYIGVHDNADNYVQVIFAPASNYTEFRVYGGASVSGQVYLDSNGLNSSWTNPTYMGFGNMGSDNVLRLYKSPDGQTWTEMCRATVGGTFNKATTGIYYMGGCWDGGTGFIVTADDHSFWTYSAGGANKMKVRVGSAWVAATPKVRAGGVWVTANPKARVGGAWVAPKQ